jgi:hypothetical protein
MEQAKPRYRGAKLDHQSGPNDDSKGGPHLVDKHMGFSPRRVILFQGNTSTVEASYLFCMSLSWSRWAVAQESSGRPVAVTTKLV